jgi:hypothetical protein
MSLNPDEVGGKEYWHDKALASRQGATPADGSRTGHPQRTDGPGQTLARSRARKYRNLRHPIAGFVGTIVAIILVTAGLLAATGGGALPVAPVRIADCAMPSAALLGPPGAQFSVAFPDRAGVAGDGPGFCGYGMTRATGDVARPLELSASVLSGPFRVNGVSVTGGLNARPFWVTASELTPVSRNGARGLEAFGCDARTDRCYGWLGLARGRLTWGVAASGDIASLRAIKAFVLSFKPAS